MKIILIWAAFLFGVAHSTPNENVKFYFSTEIFPQLLKSECNLKKAFCHIDPHDPGGLTCCGVSVKNNAEWFKEQLNEFFYSCKIMPARYNMLFICKTEGLKLAVRKLYWTKYSKGIKKCPLKAYRMLVDSSVLSGLPTAVKLLQKSHGLDQDGIFGPKTLKACQNFNPDAFTLARIERFYRLPKKLCKKYCKQWSKRAKLKLKNYYN